MLSTYSVKVDHFITCFFHLGARWGHNLLLCQVFHGLEFHVKVFAILVDQFVTILMLDGLRPVWRCGLFNLSFSFLARLTLDNKALIASEGLWAWWHARVLAIIKFSIRVVFLQLYTRYSYLRIPAFQDPPLLSFLQAKIAIQIVQFLCEANHVIEGLDR